MDYTIEKSFASDNINYKICFLFLYLLLLQWIKLHSHHEEYHIYIMFVVLLMRLFF